jgi:hypothetical protein
MEDVDRPAAWCQAAVVFEQRVDAKCLSNQHAGRELGHLYENKYTRPTFVAVVYKREF